MSATPRDGTFSFDKMSSTPRVSRRRVVEAARKQRVELAEIYIVIEADPDPDTSYLDQDDFADRREAYRRGDFRFIGVYAEADIAIEGTLQTLRSAGLWGIEDDSGRDYIEEVAVEEYAALRDILKTVGVPTSKLPQANLETVRRFGWR